MSTHIPRLLFGLPLGGGDDDGASTDSSGGHRGGGCSSARSDWSTESSGTGLVSPDRSPVHSRAGSPRLSPRGRGGLQIVVDQTFSPGGSPYNSDYNSDGGAGPGGIEDSWHEDGKVEEPYNATATPVAATPSGTKSRRAVTAFVDGSQDGVLTMALHALFQECSANGHSLTAEEFHHLFVQSQMRRAGGVQSTHLSRRGSSDSSVASANMPTPSQMMPGSPKRLKSRSSSVESEEDIVAAYVSRHLHELPFLHEVSPLFEALDRDGDHYVDFDELANWVRKGLRMQEEKLETFRASGVTEGKLVLFLESIIDFCHEVASNVHDEVYEHDRHGSARLDREGFIDVLNRGAKKTKEFVQKKHVKEYMRFREVKWITEDTLCNLCEEALDDLYEGEEHVETSDSETERDHWNEQRVFHLLRKVADRCANTALVDGMDQLATTDVLAVATEIETRRSLKLNMPALEAGDDSESSSAYEPSVSSASSSLHDEGDRVVATTEDRAMRPRRGSGKRSSFSSVPGKIERSHSAVVEVREPDPGVVGKKMQRRWSSFFGPQYAAAPESSSAAVRRPGDTVQQTMQIFQRERRSSRGAATIEEQCAAFAKLDALGRGGQAKKK